MADAKISALTSATTPLAGTEVVPIVQSGTTVKVSVANLTAGRVVGMLRGNIEGAYDANNPSTSSTPILRVNEGGALSLWVSAKAYNYVWLQAIQDDGSNNVKQLYLNPLGGGAAVVGDLTLDTGNLLISASGKGVTLPGGITWTSGSGSPEGVVTAPVGSLYSRTDGGVLTSLYVKESGTGNTGWAGK